MSDSTVGDEVDCVHRALWIADDATGIESSVQELCMASDSWYLNRSDSCDKRT
jgi:hypothetical protein